MAIKEEKETSFENNNENQKRWLVALLLLTSIAAAFLLWHVEPAPTNRLESVSQLDSLMTFTFHDFNLAPHQIRQQSVEIDSVFSRNIYTVRVPPGFSKTTLHYQLNQTLRPYNVETLATVQFPERNMRIHVLVNDKVHRTVVVRADPGLFGN